MMENTSLLKNTLDPNLVRDAAIQTGMDPSFIEKDWHAVRLLSQLSLFKTSRDIMLIFSGGTSLSKGYGLIERFSEDLDFIVTAKSECSEGQRRSFRREIIGHIRGDGHFQVTEKDIIRGNKNCFFKAPLHYKRAFEGRFLRPHLQLEMTFIQNKLPALIRPIRSIIAEQSGAEPETQIMCLSPLETGADKLSALSWRLLVRDRQAKNDDPTIIRHLHDLAALQKEIIEGRDDFIKCFDGSFHQDRERRGGALIAGLSPKERLSQAYEKLQSDSQYRSEYDQFVRNMSYAQERQVIEFDQALAIFKNIIALSLKP